MTCAGDGVESKSCGVGDACPSEHCPKDFPLSDGKTCYHHSTESLTAPQAAVKCALMGGRLYSRLAPSYADTSELWVGKCFILKD